MICRSHVPEPSWSSGQPWVPALEPSCSACSNNWSAPGVHETPRLRKTHRLSDVCRLTPGQNNSRCHPPPRHIGDLMLPWRALPLPFCRHGFLPPPLTSDLTFVLAWLWHVETTNGWVITSIVWLHKSKYFHTDRPQRLKRYTSSFIQLSQTQNLITDSKY